MSLTEDKITFGKYKDLTLDKMLRDRNYCNWLVKQEWFKNQYSYLYTRVSEYNPSINFLKNNIEFQCSSINDFIQTYPYFNLNKLEELKIELTINEKKCYTYYLKCIDELRNKIIDNMTLDIKAPTNLMNKFEKKYGISRDIFKEFLTSNELKTLTKIMEDIKKAGGKEYKGGKAYLIAKERSVDQEKYWEGVLKTKYGDQIGTQYKYRNCFFDFINIREGIVYECKLNLKDFNTDQYNKYLSVLNTFRMVYLIGKDTIIDIHKNTIFTTSPKGIFSHLAKTDNENKFDKLIETFSIKVLGNIEDYFK